MATYFFGSPVDVDIRLEGEDERKQVEVKLERDRRESSPVYFDGESVVGQVKLISVFHPLITMNLSVGSQAAIRVRDGKKLVHDGIKVEFVGSIGGSRASRSLAYSLMLTCSRIVLRSRKSL
jgi:vacuolar protein sorting-associated protein 26A/B